MNHTITHTGTVSAIDADKLYVRVARQSACSGCHARGVCRAVGGGQAQEVVVARSADDFRVGDTVELLGKTSDGLLAVFLAFVVPFVLVLLSLLLFTGMLGSETKAALLSLTVLVPYYLILARFNKKIGKKIQFSVRKPTPSGD